MTDNDLFVHRVSREFNGLISLFKKNWMLAVIVSISLVSIMLYKTGLLEQVYSKFSVSLVDNESEVQQIFPVKQSGGYTLKFINFPIDERMEIEKFLVVFSDYKNYQLKRSTPSEADYWYQSNIASAKLNRNFVNALKMLNIEAKISFSGNTFEIIRKNKEVIGK